MNFLSWFSYLDYHESDPIETYCFYYFPILTQCYGAWEFVMFLLIKYSFLKIGKILI